MKKVIILKSVLIIALLAVMAGCKKEETTGNTNNPGPIPTSIVGNWEVDGKNLNTQYEKDNYSKWTFTVDAQDLYSLKFYKKNGEVTDFTGKVAYLKSDYKHTSGSPITYMTIQVYKINGQDMPGGWKSMYSFEAGNILVLNMEPNVSGVNGPNAAAGFGSGSGGNNTVYRFVKK